MPRKMLSLITNSLLTDYFRLIAFDQYFSRLPVQLNRLPTSLWFSHAMLDHKRKLLPKKDF